MENLGGGKVEEEIWAILAHRVISSLGMHGQKQGPLATAENSVHLIAFSIFDRQSLKLAPKVSSLLRPAAVVTETMLSGAT